MRAIKNEIQISITDLIKKLTGLGHTLCITYLQIIIMTVSLSEQRTLSEKECFINSESILPLIKR